MSAINCWRCNRRIGDAEGTGRCFVVMVCKRCNAKNRIDFHAESNEKTLDKVTASGIIRTIK